MRFSICYVIILLSLSCLYLITDCFSLALFLCHATHFNLEIGFAFREKKCRLKANMKWRAFSFYRCNKIITTNEKIQNRRRNSLIRYVFGCGINIGKNAIYQISFIYLFEIFFLLLSFLFTKSFELFNRKKRKNKLYAGSVICIFLYSFCCFRCFSSLLLCKYFFHHSFYFLFETF